MPTGTFLAILLTTTLATNLPNSFYVFTLHLISLLIDIDIQHFQFLLRLENAQCTFERFTFQSEDNASFP